MIQIIPAILATTEDQYKENLAKITSSEATKGGWLHVDLADGKFVPNQTVGAEVLKNNPTDLKVEAHLMVENPNLWEDQLKEAGVKRIIAHIEAGEGAISGLISSCQADSIEVGLAIKMDTPLEKLEPYLEKIDLVLIMTIKPGFQGQPFIPESLDRIKEVTHLCKTLAKPFMIGVDGHVNEEDVKKITEAGAEHLIVGSYLLKGSDFDENLEKLWQKINS
jgi:ribulose-phosphate 3-epimerase